MDNNQLSDSLMITAYCKSKYFKKDFCTYSPNLIWQHAFGSGKPNDFLVYGLLLDASHFSTTRTWKPCLWFSEIKKCFASTSDTNASRLIHESLNRLETAKHLTRTTIGHRNPSDESNDIKIKFDLKTHFDSDKKRATYDPLYDDNPHEDSESSDEIPF